MRLFFYFVLSIILSNCTTVEVTKEIIKAGNSVKTSITDIIDAENSEKKAEKNDLEKIEEEKEMIDTEQKKEKTIIETQQQVIEMNFKEKSLNTINEILGEPDLERVDGNTYMLRYDSNSCHLFLFFDKNRIKNNKVEYFELRDRFGNLIDRKDLIESCYKELNLINQ